MTITNGYATLLQVKADLGITDTSDDTRLEAIITAVSRAIDKNRRRRIYTATETRYFTPLNSELCIVDDLITVTTLKSDENLDGTYEITWATTDYWLRPYNATLYGVPYTSIERQINGDYYFVALPRTIEIAGTFGYATTTPSEITEACIKISSRVFKRKDMLFGTVGNAALGTVDAIAPLMRDGEIMMLLESVPKRIVI